MTSNLSTSRSGELKMLRAVAIEADAWLERTEALGGLAARALGSGSAGRSQMTGLDAIVSSTQKLSDVLDYIKVRTARQPGWRADDFGFQLVSFLTTEVRSRAQDIARREKLSDEDRHRVALILAQAAIRQIVAHYEFARAFPQLVGVAATASSMPRSAGPPSRLASKDRP